MMEVIHSSETSVFTRATGRNIPKDAIFYSHCRKNLKSYIKVAVAEYSMCGSYGHEKASQGFIKDWVSLDRLNNYPAALNPVEYRDRLTN
jgi:hypothetical protein